MTESVLRELRDSLADEINRLEVRSIVREVRTSPLMSFSTLMNSMSERVKEFLPKEGEISIHYNEIDVEAQHSREAQERTLVVLRKEQ